MKFSAAIWPALIRSFSLLPLALLAAGCPVYTRVTVDGGWASLTGSGQTATENRTVGAFSKIEVSGAATLDVEIGNITTLAVATDDNVLPLIETKVEGDTLHIRPVKNYRSTLGVKVKITTPALEGVTTSGACDISARGLEAKAFALDISGAGNAHLAGKTAVFAVHLSGAGNIEAADLAAENVEVEISGAGHAVVCATASLDASVSGVGAVRYTGHPAEVKKNVSGFGSITAE
jgi:hypothetical protein